MSYLVDTDIASAYLRGNPRVFHRFIQHAGRLHLSIVSLVELYTCVYAAQDSSRREEGLLAMLSDVVVLPLDDDVARQCGQTRALLQRQGTKIPTLDMLIAATALGHDLIIVTHNTRHFRLVPDLRMEDWLTS